MTEWGNVGEIKSVTFTDIDGNCAFTVGSHGITRIEKMEKSGMHSAIAYVRVWKGNDAVAEFCQHGLTGVFFMSDGGNDS